MILPKDDDHYGFCLTFRKSRGAETESGTQRAGLVSRLAELNLW